MRPCGSRQKWNTPGSKMNMKSRSPPPSCAVSKSIGRGGLVHGWLDLSRRSFQRLHTRRRLRYWLLWRDDSHRVEVSSARGLQRRCERCQTLPIAHRPH
mmetsp:Transcript_66559/g.182536  ORF Transcript_66559/g.182536 Transcript_66559/m.182536 type:complete len:99 (-) Transcript_66559:1341-1637(-)